MMTFRDNNGVLQLCGLVADRPEASLLNSWSSGSYRCTDTGERFDLIYDSDGPVWVRDESEVLAALVLELKAAYAEYPFSRFSNSRRLELALLALVKS